MGIKAVVFDIDGTLYYSSSYLRHLTRSIIEALAELMKVDLKEAEMRFLSIKNQVKTISMGLKLLGIDRHRFYEVVVEKVEPCKYIRPRPELKKLLANLKAKKIKVGCHTNSSRKLAEKVLKCLGLSLNDFDLVITCDDAEPKPSEEGYLTVMKILGLKPDEILYVGDRWEVEIEPAKKLGMKTALVSRKLHGEPDIHLGDVMEILDKLDKLDC
ncbi:MAG: hypothetical protein DRN49_04345 [Thaumarchaeota archaeon]|nr:MAG: hypothetical protein DRN49_04345 [Nitrososphaerota archaeon]